MSNQLQITGGAKVRNLQGVITGTSGVLGALGINVPDGIPQLDGSGKILVSQLPNSVMEYKGTWNVATNTPYLVDGVGNAGDVYIVTGAATGGTTHDFGNGPILFYNGDQAIYDGSLWQRASGSSGTVTSVAMTTPTGLSVTGSPITTSGTLALSLSSGYTIPTTSFLSGLVPYTGATQTVDLGAYDLNARGIKINGTGGLGHADFKHQSGTPTGSASSSTLYADTDGNLAWLNDHSHTITLAASANSADRTYTLQDANGTLAFLSDIPSLSGYVTLGTNQTITGIKTFTNEQLFGNGMTLTGGYITYTSGSYNLTLNTNILTANRNVFLQDKSGTIALTSDISYPVTSVFGRTGAVTAQSGDYTTSLVTEGSNLYFTNARARAAISLTTTGTSGAATYNSTTGVLNIPNYSETTFGTVTSVGLSSATSGVTIGSSPITTSGVITLDIATASGTQQGLLSSTDWTTFNNKQNALTNPVTGTGTTNTLPKFTGSTAIGNSNITDTGSLITLGSNSYVNGALGIGTSNLIGYSLHIGKDITGATSAFAILQDGIIQSDVTSSARYFDTYAQTQATAFTLANLFHYRAGSNTFGAGSTVGNQYGFYAASSVIGATNNYGFYGDIASGTGRWNFYMNGTASNYMAGSLGMGSTNLTGINFRISKTITGVATSYGILQDSVIQSGVTTAAFINRSLPYTVAATFTLGSLYHYAATQGTIGAGSTVTNQYGFFVDSGTSGATNNFGFYGDIASGANRWNLYMNGTANNYLAGSLGIGSTSLTGININVNKTLTGATTTWSVYNQSQIQSDVTVVADYFRTNAQTVAATFTLPNLAHYRSAQATFGAGSIITNQFGFIVDATLTGATNNYGFYGNLGAASNVWNLYMAGTANNYMAGSLGIGSTSLTAYNLRNSKNISGSASLSVAYSADGTVQSDVTTTAQGYRSVIATQAAAFTLTNLQHFVAGQGTFGAGSTVTNQYAFYADAGLISATNNYGFYSAMTVSGTSRWALYMAGTAPNYINSVLTIGTASPNASAKVQIDSTTQGFLPPRMTSAQRTAISTPATGLMVYQTDGTEGVYVYTSAGWKSLTMV